MRKSATQKVDGSHSGSPLILKLPIKSKKKQLAVAGCWTETCVAHWSALFNKLLDRKPSGSFKLLAPPPLPSFDGFIYLTFSTTLIHKCHARIHAPFTKPQTPATPDVVCPRVLTAARSPVSCSHFKPPKTHNYRRRDAFRSLSHICHRSARTARLLCSPSRHVSTADKVCHNTWLAV